MRVLGYIFAWLALALAGAWTLMDALATDLIRTEMGRMSADALVDFEEAGLRAPNTAYFSNVSLDDPVTGERVGFIRSLEVDLGVRSDDEGHWGPVVHRIRGTSGEAVLTTGDMQTGLIRAIAAVVEMLGTLSEGSDGPSAPPPPMEFRHLTVRLKAEGLALQSVPDCTVWIESRDDRIEVDIALPTGGRVELIFDRTGIRVVDAKNVPMAPAMAALVSPTDAEVARALRPHGTLDLRMELDLLAGEVVAEGSIRGATLRPVAVPFPLEDCFVPFEFREGKLLVEGARIGPPGGGEVACTLQRTDERVSLAIDAEDIPFLERYLGLIPSQGNLQWLAVDDGGTLALHLDLDYDGTELTVTGEGGVHAERAEIAVGDLFVEDVVGRFSVEDDVLNFRSVSARCASGAVFLDGELDIPSSRMVIDVDVADMDVGELSKMLTEGDTLPDLRGWVQGHLRLKSVLGVPRSNRGTGRLSVRAGRLWGVPLIDRVAETVDAEEDAGEGEARQQLELRFDVRGRKIEIEELRLSSDILSFFSKKGEIKFAGEPEVDLEIELFDVPLGLVGTAIEYLGSNLLGKVDVTGPLRDPEVTAVPVPVVTRPLSRFFSWVGGLFTSDDESQESSDDIDSE